MSGDGGDALLLAAATAAPALFAGLLFVAARSRRAAAPGVRPGWVRLAAGNLLVTGLLLALLFLAGECWYRFAHDEPDAFGLTRAHQRWLERHQRANRAGVRDDVEYLLEKAPGASRALLLGDSFTVGQGVEVGRRFANLLRAAGGARRELHVLARNGWSTAAELEALRGLPPGYPLDAVLLVYNVNDMAELIPEWRGTLDRIYRGHREEGFLVRHSFLVNTLHYRRLVRTTPELARYYGLLRASYDSPLFERQQRLFAEFAAECRRRAVPCGVVTFPLLHELGAAYPYRSAHARLAAAWRDLGVPHLDLLPRFAGRAPRDLVVSRWDSHPNEAAHRIAAAAIAPFLDALLVETTPPAMR